MMTDPEKDLELAAAWITKAVDHELYLQGRRDAIDERLGAHEAVPGVRAATEGHDVEARVAANERAAREGVAALAGNRDLFGELVRAYQAAPLAETDDPAFHGRLTAAIDRTREGLLAALGDD